MYIVMELRKREQSFLYVTHCLDLINMAIKFHSIWLPSYGRHKDSAKKNYQREVTWKQRKGDQPSFAYDTLLKPHTHCYKVSSRYSIRLPTYGTHKFNQKFHPREVTQKLRKGEQSFFIRNTSS